MRSPVTITIVALSAGLTLAACGSSSPKHHAGLPDFVAYSHCMRAHGVPNFPDPSAGGGIHLDSSTGLDPAAPAFKAAQRQCAKLFPGGGPGRQQPTGQAKQQMLAVSECMRAHGVTGFPDPTLTPPSNPDDFSLAIGRGGVFLAVPKTIDVNTPVFRQAAQACSFGGPGGPRRGAKSIAAP
jgi:hypothetical protein